MAYSTGMLKDRITILNRASKTEGEFGVKGGNYAVVKTVWAAVDWTRGVKAMREGALDAYDIIMVRCRYTSSLTRESRIRFDGKDYLIQSFHADKGENTIQLTAQELQVS